MNQQFSGPAAAKTVDEVVEQKSFGNLSKSVPLVIISAGLVVALVVVVAKGGDYNALLNGALIIAGAAGAGALGSATTYLGDSQTQKDMKAIRAANTVPVANGSGKPIAGLPVESNLTRMTDKRVDPPADETKTVDEVLDPLADDQLTPPNAVGSVAAQ